MAIVRSIFRKLIGSLKKDENLTINLRIQIVIDFINKNLNYLQTTVLPLQVENLCLVLYECDNICKEKFEETINYLWIYCECENLKSWKSIFTKLLEYSIEN